jgi:hypothetical protein
MPAIGVELEGLDPLLGMLAVLPALDHFGMSPLGCLLEGGDNLPALLERINAGCRELPGCCGFQPLRAHWDVAYLTDTDIAPGSVHLDAQNPALPARRRDFEIETVAIWIASGLG